MLTAEGSSGRKASGFPASPWSILSGWTCLSPGQISAGNWTYTKNNPHDPAPNRTGFFRTEIMGLLGPNYAHPMAAENRDITGTVPERPRLSREKGTEHGREKVRDDCLAVGTVPCEPFSPKFPAQQGINREIAPQISPSRWADFWAGKGYQPLFPPELVIRHAQAPDF